MVVSLSDQSRAVQQSGELIGRLDPSLALKYPRLPQHLLFFRQK